MSLVQIQLEESILIWAGSLSGSRSICGATVDRKEPNGINNRITGLYPVDVGSIPTWSANLTMKTLIISDIHNRTRWINPFLYNYKQAYGYDQVVFLGDYFDQFGDGPNEAKETALWLKASLQHKDRIHLLGNHDMPYMCPGNELLWCPGWDKYKNTAVNRVMTPQAWDMLRPCVEVDGWLLSHAGASEWVFNHPIKGISLNSIIEQTEKALIEAKKNNITVEFGYGSRMDSLVNVTGGITWLDWNDEFVPIEGINQIVGHTPGNQPKRKNVLHGNSENWCLDTHSQHIGILLNGTLTITQCHGVIHQRTGRVIAHHKTQS